MRDVNMNFVSKDLIDDFSRNMDGCIDLRSPMENLSG
jgi:hypothetical protein